MNVSNHEDESVENASVFLIVPIFLAALFYLALALWLYPHARPVMPISLLIFGLLFPPFLPFVFFYTLYTFYTRPVIIVEPDVGQPPQAARSVVVVQSWRHPRFVGATPAPARTTNSSSDRRDRRPNGSSRV